MVAMSCQPSGSEQVVTNVCICPASLTPLLGVLIPLFGAVFAGLKSQSPETGRSPSAPKAARMSNEPVRLALTLFKPKVVAPKTLLGRSTPMVSTPSPFQSPTTGRAPGAVPNRTVISAAPAELELRRAQLP